MAKYEDGCYGSLKGIALIGKVLAGRCRMRYTRVAVGKGILSDSLTPKTLTEPPDYVMDAAISGIENPVDGECQVSVQINSASSNTTSDTEIQITAFEIYPEEYPDGLAVPMDSLVASRPVTTPSQTIELIEL